ncbi:hypothetical protein [Victivallis sp. Marseille-Q1083]|nr:hypothetical protein [Victivallis sp. Marseille-Q1083]
MKNKFEKRQIHSKLMPYVPPFISFSTAREGARQYDAQPSGYFVA